MVNSDKFGYDLKFCLFHQKPRFILYMFIYMYSIVEKEQYNFNSTALKIAVNKELYMKIFSFQCTSCVYLYVCF